MMRLCFCSVIGLTGCDTESIANTDGADELVQIPERFEYIGSSSDYWARKSAQSPTRTAKSVVGQEIQEVESNNGAEEEEEEELVNDPGDRWVVVDRHGNAYLEPEQSRPYPIIDQPKRSSGFTTRSDVPGSARDDKIRDLFRTPPRRGPTALPVGLPDVDPAALEERFRAVIGSDNRTVKTSSSYPWGAVGVRLKIDIGSGNYRTCSASYVGPRHVLTSAHCLVGVSAGDVQILPAARGFSYSGDRFPYGIDRWGVLYYVPSGYSPGTTNAKYDYAVVIAADTNSIPGWIGFAAWSASSLYYLDLNDAGYPGRSRTCLDSPTTSGAYAGKCDLYMYRQYTNLTTSGCCTTYFEHDLQDGQSGMPLYYYDSGNGERDVLVVAKGDWSSGANKGHKIRSGSYDTICSAIEDNPSSYYTYGGC